MTFRVLNVWSSQHTHDCAVSLQTRASFREMISTIANRTYMERKKTRHRQRRTTYSISATNIRSGSGSKSSRSRSTS